MRLAGFRTYSIALVFLAALFFPLLNGNLELITDIESFENRAMAKQPAFDIEHLDPFPAKYDTFYNDAFNLRNRLIRYFNIYKVRAYRKSPVNSVVIGADNWLYLTGDEMDSYMGKNRLSFEELQAFKMELEYRKKYLDEKGIKFYFLVIPCKASVYPENIGYEYFRMYKDSWGEQLNRYLGEHSSIKPIDAFDSLRSHKATGNLFYKLDNHWNELGAFFTSNIILSRMKADFPGLQYLSLNDFELKRSEYPAENLEAMLGRLDVFSEASLQVKPKKGFRSKEVDPTGYPIDPAFPYPSEFEKVRVTGDSTKPSLLIIGDSFGLSIFPFISENFSKTTKIFDAWKYAINENIVEGERPDAVLLMIDEPILRSILKFSPRVKK